MASAPYADKTKEPPPYSTHQGSNLQVVYQQQHSAPVYPSTMVIASVPPPVTTVAVPVHVQTPYVHTVIAAPFLGREPASIQCPRCRQQILTSIDFETGCGTWIIATVVFFLGGFMGCCLIPFCVSSCKDAVHVCPSCRVRIGVRALM